MRLVGFLKDHIPAVILVVCLLVVQAYADLSLPRLTSDIVDVGIQQQGVEHVSVEEMRATTFDAACMMLSAEDEDLVRASYDAEGSDKFVLNEQGRKNREQLDDALAVPMIVIANAQALGSNGFDLAQIQSAYNAGLVTKAQVLEGMSQMSEKLYEMGDSIVAQQGIAAATSEYEAVGYDLSVKQMGSLLSIGGMMLGMAALCMILNVLVSLVSARTGAKVGKSLRERLFSQVLSFSEAEIGGFSAASLITRGTNDIQQIQMVLTLLMRMVFYSPILAIGGIIMILQTNAQMGWIVVVAVVAVFVVIGILFAFTMPKFRIMQTLVDRVNLVSRETLNGLPVIRAFGREELEEGRFDVASTNLMKTQMFTNRAMAFMIPAMMCIMNLTSVAIVWFGGGYINDGTLQTGDLIAFITYSMVIVMSFLMLGMVAIILPRANVAAVRVHEVLSCKPTINDPAQPKDDQLASVEEAPGATIAFNHVSFGYDAAAEHVLEDITFTAEAGKVCAIVGSTGCGKSTLMKLIERFYDVSEGSVTIDGIDVRDLSQHALRTQIGYVPQKAFLFSGTVESNIAYSDADMTDENIRTAADIAQATSFVEEMEDGFSSEISQGGTNVSGGQRQRLAIARALALPARVYLFDDSFSALDYKTDAALRGELSARLAGRTLIIVAQRISTVLAADNIIVVDDGRIVAQGTHDFLMDTSEEYREIAYSQLSEEELRGGGRHE